MYLSVFLRVVFGLGLVGWYLVLDLKSKLNKIWASPTLNRPQRLIALLYSFMVDAELSSQMTEGSRLTLIKVLTSAEAAVLSRSMANTNKAIDMSKWKPLMEFMPGTRASVTALAEFKFPALAKSDAVIAYFKPLNVTISLPREGWKNSSNITFSFFTPFFPPSFLKNYWSSGARVNVLRFHLRLEAMIAEKRACSENEKTDGSTGTAGYLTTNWACWLMM